MSNMPKTITKAIENTAHLKDMPMVEGTEGIKNFFVIHETELIRVGIKLTAESMGGIGHLCLRVRIVPQTGTVLSMMKLYDDTFHKKMEQSKYIQHTKYVSERISFIIHSGIKVDSTTVHTTEVDDVVKALLLPAIDALKVTFDMKLDRKGFSPILRELCAIGLPLGVKELAGEDELDTTDDTATEKQTGSVTSIDKNKDK